jgi:hypothetical protein
MSEKIIRLELEYSDGRRATNLDRLATNLEDEPPRDIRLIQGGGGGGGCTYKSDYWAWPLPPPGPVKVTVEWGSIDLRPTAVEIDAGLILDAAQKSERPWDSD